MTLGLKRLRREDSPLAVLAVVSVWPADADGFYRIALSDHAAAIVYRLLPARIDRQLQRRRVVAPSP